MYTSMYFKSAATASLLVMHQFVQLPDDRYIQEWTGYMRDRAVCLAHARTILLAFQAWDIVPMLLADSGF